MIILILPKSVFFPDTTNQKLTKSDWSMIAKYNFERTIAINFGSILLNCFRVVFVKVLWKVNLICMFGKNWQN
jgi:hypothetical protein